MLSDVNLIPQEEVIEQKKTAAVKSSSVFSILFLLLALGISVYFYVTTSKIEADIKRTDGEIENFRSKIKSMSDVEVAARNLDKKYSSLKLLFDSRSRYSLLLKEVQSRKPDDVLIQNLDTKVGEISISGTSGSYVSVKNFMDNLLNKDFEGGDSRLKDLFVEVSLNSVNLDKSSNTVKFFIVVSYQDGRLQGL
jgi:Tfp pilus assembly protein PilN